ncbi:hypothetical protein [Streptomyces sp. MZ04]|uniref:hypothetical protein n=1 Tax=Streptomyces sp. MZ04 TaxID=2559236 RepID=UPI00107EE846|nr:hypothetical protein [Streptomyces sp. MZ04]TGB00771.1 hypothetical protein E2651_28305 [Streptomyces sp. MZ04]
MTTITNISEALTAAESALEAQGTARTDLKESLAGYVKRLTSPEASHAPLWATARQHINLAQLLLALGMTERSLSLADVTLRHMEIVEADREMFAPDTWNELGSLLAEHDDLDRARMVFAYALNRAQRRAAPELGRILANLSAASLRAGHPEDAAVWAQKAVTVLGRSYGSDPEARLTADWVRVEAASSRRDIAELRRAIPDFAESVDWFITSLKGDDDPKAIAARSALAEARFRVAAAEQNDEQAEEQLGELEIAHLRAVALLGPEHQQTLIAQAALAAAEYQAAEGTDLCTSRRQQAVALLDDATAKAARTLGSDHSQTLELRAALADMRGDSSPSDELPYAIERVYTPEESSARNMTKGKAIRRERNMIRLVAHAGASFFLKDLRRFHPQLIHALNQGSYFYAIISSPWNSLAMFTKHDATAERPNSDNIVDIVMASDYYDKTFLPVLDSYHTLEETYPGQVELRITHIDIPGSTLLTTHKGFFEPYITSNPERRTRRKFNVFEVEFHRDSRYYADSRAEFEIQWELASTLIQFKANEDQHKMALRDAVRAQSLDYLKSMWE